MVAGDVIAEVVVYKEGILKMVNSKTVRISNHTQ